jgi:hypothetical protein
MSNFKCVTQHRCHKLIYLAELKCYSDITTSPHFPTFWPLVTTLHSLPLSLAIRAASCRCNHTVFVLLGLDYVTDHNILQVYATVAYCRIPFFLKAE